MRLAFDWVEAKRKKSSMDCHQAIWLSPQGVLIGSAFRCEISISIWITDCFDKFASFDMRSVSLFEKHLGVSAISCLAGDFPAAIKILTPSNFPEMMARTQSVIPFSTLMSFLILSLVASASGQSTGLDKGAHLQKLTSVVQSLVDEVRQVPFLCFRSSCLHSTSSFSILSKVASS